MTSHPMCSIVSSRRADRTCAVADFAYVWTAEDWLYVAAVIVHRTGNRPYDECLPRDEAERLAYEQARPPTLRGSMKNAPAYPANSVLTCKKVYQACNSIGVDAMAHAKRGDL